MWIEIIEKVLSLVTEKFLDSQSSKRKSAKAITNLYLSMLNCHQAYVNFLKRKNDVDEVYDNNEKAAYEWVSAIHNLSSNFYRLHTALNIFDTDLSFLVMGYTFKEIRSAEKHLNDKPYASLLRKKVNFEDFTKQENMLSLTLEEITRSMNDKDMGTNTMEDFQKATDLLRKFIQKHFTFDEIIAQ